MQKHAALLRPKFEAVTTVFERELGGSGLAAWTKPRGGYFVSLAADDDRVDIRIDRASSVDGSFELSLDVLVAQPAEELIQGATRSR